MIKVVASKKMLSKIDNIEELKLLKLLYVRVDALFNRSSGMPETLLDLEEVYLQLKKLIHIDRE